MLALKTIVAAMAVLLVAGFGALVGGLVMQAKQKPEAAFSGAEVSLPRDARIVETTQSGDRLVLRAALPDGQERLYVIDIAAGRLIGMIAVKRGQ
jgi:hypothetical protein